MDNPVSDYVTTVIAPEGGGIPLDMEARLHESTTFSAQIKRPLYTCNQSRCPSSPPSQLNLSCRCVAVAVAVITQLIPALSVEGATQIELLKREAKTSVMRSCLEELKRIGVGRVLVGPYTSPLLSST